MTLIEKVTNNLKINKMFYLILLAIAAESFYLNSKYEKIMNIVEKQSSGYTAVMVSQDEYVNRLEEAVSELKEDYPIGSLLSSIVQHYSFTVIDEPVKSSTPENLEPPLNGYQVFVKDADNVGYYVFSKFPLYVEKGDKIVGWFASTGLGSTKNNIQYSALMPTELITVNPADSLNLEK